ncbi:sodium/potassium-transporting ATPase subunit beta-2 [Planococcus citri]|uniref:sodium/potassium-transporting ATPase subunit beta-2 n=1 Tax=Planococcus citri TaxID=170843 RepID=UPI0031F9D842
MDKKDKEEFYSPPPKLGKGEQCMTFIWNPETKEFMGRTAGSWAKILLFYLIFYIVLSVYWGGLWVAFKAIAINKETPRYMLKESLIGTNPGLGFRPMPAAEFVDSALIWYNQNNYGYLNWTTQLEKFLKPYYGDTSSRPEDRNPNVQNCTYETPTKNVPPNRVCRVPIEKFAPCHQQHYQYDKGSPCIFLKLNRIFNWIPEYYNDSKILPEKMPNHLKLKIKNIEDRNRYEMNTVWVSCEGENAADREHIGPISMFPSPGFPGFYFPFSNAKGYLSPLVAVWFEKPTKGVLINVECKAWAKNIEYDRHDRRGSVHFELMID